MVGEYTHPRLLRCLRIAAVLFSWTLVLAELVIPGKSIVDPTSGTDIGSFDPVILFFMSFVTLSVLLYELKRHPEQTARFLMAGIATGGVISGLILLQLWAQSSFNGEAAFFLIAAPLAYVGLYSTIKYYRGSLSEKQAGLLLAICAVLLGGLLGIFFPTVFMVILLVSLSIFDLFSIESNLLARTVGLVKLDSLLSQTTLPVSDLGVGLGDLLAYSILVTNSLLRGGLFATEATGILILSGVLLTAKIAKGRNAVAGLPIPIFLGLVPTILRLTNL